MPEAASAEEGVAAPAKEGTVAAGAAPVPEAAYAEAGVAAPAEEGTVAAGAGALPARFAHVQSLMADEPRITAWVRGMADDLEGKHYTVMDDFLERELAVKLAVEVRKAWREGRLVSGQLAGGRSGQNKRYTLADIRGDRVGWFQGDPCRDDSTGRQAVDVPADGRGGACWRGTALQTLMKRLNTLVQMLGVMVPELRGIESRSEAMVTCYPGEGSRYVKHCDNPHRNGRKLTVLYYLNHSWKQGDGGELRMYAPDGAVLEDVAPIADRLVVFFSDERVPHEVLPAHAERFAITHWFYDHSERTEAEHVVADVEIEQRRIEAEIAKFEAETNAAATVTPSKLPAPGGDMLATTSFSAPAVPKIRTEEMPADGSAKGFPRGGRTVSVPLEDTDRAADFALTVDAERATLTLRGATVFTQPVAGVDADAIRAKFRKRERRLEVRMPAL